MNDTPKTVEQRYHHMLMQKSGEERLRMGCSMFDAVCEIVRCSIREKFPGITAKRMRQQIFLRLYGQDFNEEQKKNILKALA